MRWVHDTASGPVAFGLPLPAARADRRQRSASTLTRGGPNLGGWSVFRTSRSGGETMTTYEGRLELTWTEQAPPLARPRGRDLRVGPTVRLPRGRGQTAAGR